ncbi:MAG: stage III sporulation protein AF [Bacillota bacterium]|jgi:stage III sporulation protein AF
MDTVIMIVKNLVVLAFLSLFLELILPKGSTKKYAKFVMGLLVITVMINPILHVIGEEMPAVAEIAGDSSAVSAEDIIADGQIIKGNISEAAVSEYEADISRQMKKMLSVVDGVDDVMTDISFDNDNIKAVTLVLAVKPEFESNPEKIKEIRQQTENILSEFYGVEAENINVSISKRSE